MYYVYVICCRGGGWYTGMTPDLCRRMRTHARGKGGSYTRAHPPEALCALWRCADGTAARRLEYAVKQLRRGSKEQLVAAPDTVGAVFPHLNGEDYTPVTGVTIEDCWEGRFHD